ncbi:hypothetical protein [Hyalangium sp.]|uniref:hypothetical protein n=1 Tax=Hyalangium sp. TaxID=2028555 RepID=UPI002D5BFB49|nr:hypothetical protein [Hyalangium sp.]HYH99161.1 hypothetical protein [Hyalangium sp.]
MSALPAEHRAYLQAVRRLQERGVVFAVIGSFALRLRMDALDSEPVPDCDLVVDPAPDNLQRWAATLAEEGWALEVWGQPVSPPLELEHLRGKYYVRARKGALVIDGAYELDLLGVHELLARASPLQGLPVADLDTVLDLKRSRGTPRDLEVVGQVERWRQRPPAR